MFNLDTSTVLPDATIALVEELRTVRDSIKSLKSREDQIRQTLLDELKGVEEGVTASGMPVVTVERYSRTKIDGNRLQALYQDVWKDCQVETPVQVVRLPEAP